MRLTVSIDDAIYKTALDLADPGSQIEDILDDALKMYVRLKAGKRLADLGGTMPLSKDVSRRRSESDS